MADPKTKFDEINVDEFVELTFNHSSCKLAEFYNVDESSIRRWRKKVEKNGRMCGRAIFPKTVDLTYKDFLILREDNYLVFGDCEFPFADTSFLELIYSVAEKYKIKKGFINGDFIDFGSISYWPRTTPKIVTLQEEIEPALETLKIFTNVFDDLYYIQANHEKRLNYRTSGELNVGAFVKDIVGVTFTEYSYAVVESSNNSTARITHPKNYSINIGTVSKKLHYKFKQNIIMGHDHILGFHILEDGKSWILHHGCCRKPESAEYLMMVDTTMPMWVQGFCLVLNGYPHLITRENAEFYLNK